MVGDLVKELVCHVAQTAREGAAPLATPKPSEGGSAPKSGARQRVPVQIEHKDADGKVVRTIDLKRPWRRARYVDLVREVAGKDWVVLSRGERGGPAPRENGLGRV